jgi:hypothetical protein
VSGISILSSVLNHLAARFHFTRSAYARFPSLALLSSSQFGNRNLWSFGYYSRFVFRMSRCFLTFNLEDENRYTCHPFLQNKNRARRNSRNQVILTLILLMWRIGWAPNGIPICIQQDAKLHIYLYLETAPHVPGGTSTNHQERTPPTAHSTRFQLFHDSGR